MRTRRISKTAASAWIAVGVILALAAFLQSQVRNPARTSPPAAEYNDGRAVYGQFPAPPEALPEPQRQSEPQQLAGRTRSREADTPVPPNPAPQPPQLPRSGGRPQPEPDTERFLHYRPPGATVGDPGPLAAADPGELSRVSEADTTEQVASAVHRWADTFLARNWNAHTALYAPVLERFHGRARVSRAEVRQLKERELSAFSQIRKYEIRSLRVRQNADGSADATFQRDWEFQGPGRSQGSALERLVFRRIAGNWKIVREESLPNPS